MKANPKLPGRRALRRRPPLATAVTGAAVLIFSLACFAPATLAQTAPIDFGDAPRPYPDAWHNVIQGVFLGSLVDFETGTQANDTATGDDLNPVRSPDDEDGVRFLSEIKPGQLAEVEVTASTGEGRLDAWVDFNRDGDWTDSGEQIYRSEPLNRGANVLRFTVPATAAGGTSFARFRFSFQGGLPPGGGANSGEVEDYQVEIIADEFDFGDAPENYPVLLSQDGARHSFQRDFHLGARVDLERDGQPSGAANGDDINPATADDEDGVTFVTGFITAGQTASVSVVASAGGGRLDAWIDFNRDGDWADAGEKIFNATPLTAGNNVLSFTVPAAAVAGETFARFRFGQQGGLSFTGFGGPGEVEDYSVRIAQLQLDFGDAPQNYPVVLSQDGARHQVNPDIFLGRRIDAEPDGQPSAGANGDDNNPSSTADDEDGVIFLTSPLQQGRPAQVEVTSSISQGRLDAWIDFNADGDWDDPGEQIFSSTVLAAGPNVLTFNVPAEARLGGTFSRFRLSLRGGLKPQGLAPEGEVEDHPITIDQGLLDFGDADRRYPVVLSADGARHQVQQGFFLGQLVDVEADGQPTTDASGDDLNPSAADDEDGVRFIGPIQVGAVGRVEVVVSQTGMLDAWIDFNRNFSWNDPGDQIAAARPVSTGTNIIEFNVPSNASPGTGAAARFRLSRKGGLQPTGLAEDGEVEDHPIVIVERPDVGCDPRTHRGTNFWVTFPGNYAPDPDNPVRIRLYILGIRETTGTVTIPGLGYSTNYTIPGSQEKIIELPRAAELGNANDIIENKGIHITASREVTVYGMNRVFWTSDGYLALPTDVIGRRYVVMGYGNEFTGIPDLNGTQFAMVATEDETTVNIVPRFTTGSRPAGVPYSITLDRGQTYQLRNTNDFDNDLTGSLIIADKAISVFGSHQASTVPNADLFFADHLVEQLLPAERAGFIFDVAPLAPRTRSTYRFVALFNATQILVNGANFGMINAGEMREFRIPGAFRVIASKPIFVTQYSESSDADGVVNSDPFMIVVTPLSMSLNQYLVTAPDMGFAEHYVSVVVPNALIGSVTLDGAAIPAASFSNIPTTGSSYANVKVAPGPHSLVAPSPFKATVYGWAEYDSYGFPAGMFFGDTEPPQLTCPEERTVVLGTGTAASSCFATVPDLREGVTATDNCGMPPRFNIEQTPAPGTVVGPGVHHIMLSTFDAAGNLGFCLVPFRVVDPSPLQLVCPRDMVVGCNTNGGAIVNYEVMTRRTCGPTDEAVVCDPPPGTFLKEGTHVITCTAVDSLNNNQIVTCSFRITVSCDTPGATLSVAKPAGSNSLTLTWSGNAVLEHATSIAGPWTAVPDAQGSYTVLPTGGRGFYRLRLEGE